MWEGASLKLTNKYRPVQQSILPVTKSPDASKGGAFWWDFLVHVLLNFLNSLETLFVHLVGLMYKLVFC